MSKPKYKVGDVVKFKIFNSNNKIYCGKICLIECWSRRSINCYGIIGDFNLTGLMLSFTPVIGFTRIDSVPDIDNLIGLYVEEDLIISSEDSEQIIYL